MREKTSLTTGNVFYHADNGLLSSSNKQAVQSFEEHGLKEKQDFFDDRSLAITFLYAGNCPIAKDFLRDEAFVNREARDFEKSLKTGNWCPLTVDKRVEERKVELWKARGY